MELHYSICYKLGLDPDRQLKRNIRGLPGFTTQELIFALINSDNLTQAAEILGYSSTQAIKTAIVDVLKPLFPNRRKEQASLWRTELLQVVDKKYCSSCASIKDTAEFRNHSGRVGGKSCYCSRCMTADNKQYKLSLRLRTPPWADLLKIKEVYSNCPIGMEVDHIVPLNGKNVSGLHVEYNLQYLSPYDNHAKNNKFAE